MEEKISVIVPVYNVSSYLSHTVDSLLSQEYPFFEIVLIDDGSTDGSSDICDRYANQDMRVHVCHQVNQGVSAARNAGLDQVTGKYIAFVDADDYVSPRYLSDLYQELQGNNADVSVQMYVTEFPNGKKVRSVKEDINAIMTGMEFIDFEIMGVRDTSVCCKMFRRDIIEENHIRFEKGITNLEDMLFLYFYMRSCEVVAYTTTINYFRVAHVNGVVFSGFQPKKLTALLVFDCILEDLNKSEQAKKMIPSLLRYKFQNYIFFLLETMCSAEYKILHQRLFQEMIEFRHRYVNIMRRKEYFKYYLMRYFPYLYRIFYQMKKRFFAYRFGF